MRLRAFWRPVQLAAERQQYQIIVFTCRPGDYLQTAEMPNAVAVADVGPVRAINLEQLVQHPS